MSVRRLTLAALSVAYLLLGMGCASSRAFTPKPRLPLNLTSDSPVRTYRISVSYTNQDEIGKPTDVVEIRATVRAGSREGSPYCRWESYDTRQYRAGAEPPPWKAFEPAVGFDYVMTPVAQEPNFIGNLPDMDSIPRDLTGFHFYVNLIDFHMWDLYTNLFLRTPIVFPGFTQGPLRAVGDTMTVDVRDLPIALVEWENVSSDLRMTGGMIRAELLGYGEVGGTRTRIIFFEQEQTLRQDVYGAGMKLPYEGTNRFLGHLQLDDEDRLVLASYREFVYSKVHAPMSQIVIVHTERNYRIELIASE